MADIQAHEFNKKLYFYDLVSSFSISLCGCPVIFEDEVKVYDSPNRTLGFTGVYSKNKHLAPFHLRQQALNGNIDKSKYIASCCMMLANTAYESVKQFNDGSEVFEFFRHIRNASSHLNNFQFNHKEPSKAAKWREVEINHNLKGVENELYHKPCFGYFFGVADLLDLLLDVERIIILRIKKEVDAT